MATTKKKGKAGGSRKSTKKNARKTNARPGKGGRIALLAVAAVAAALAMALLVGAINASRVEVRRAEVRLKDLPSAFDGKTLLYASDIDLCGLNTAAKSADLFRRLQSLKPDALLLGGDYTSSSLFTILNRTQDAPASQGTLKARDAFFRALSDFQAPLGKFAIRAPEDPEPDALRASIKAAGITPLFDGSAALTVGGDTVWVAGLSGEPAPIAEAARKARREDCVIAIAASPTQVTQIMINEAEGGGSWCDLILAGHTHGGQIRLFGVNLLSLNGVERNYLKGWNLENEIPILTTTGVGCEGANIRLGSRPEVWLITLRAGDSLPDLR